MSKYEKLDAAILENLSPHSRVAFCVLENIPSVKAEMELVSDASPKDRWGMKVSPFRVLDRRLQALRKSGKIRATSKGWVRVTSQEPAGASMTDQTSTRARAHLEPSQDSIDAARYRWLRSQPNNTEAPRIDVVQWSELDESANEGNGLRLEELDAAIDAAMKEAQ